MNCARVKEQLVDFLYDEMSAEERALFEAHVRTCESCGAELASYRKTLDHARSALNGPLAQEPPARVHVNIMKAAEAAVATRTPSKPAIERKTASADEPGFFARFLRTPWLLPAFGAAGVATAVFLVRVLKNPEILPGQRPRSVAEQAASPPAPVEPPEPVVAQSPGTAEGAHQPGGGKPAQGAPSIPAPAARAKNRPAKSDLNQALPAAEERVEPARSVKKKAVTDDLLFGEESSRGGGVGSLGFLAPAPEARKGSTARGNLDDLSGTFARADKPMPSRPAAQASASPAEKESHVARSQAVELSDENAPVSERELASAGPASDRVTGKDLRREPGFAEPPSGSTPMAAKAAAPRASAGYAASPPVPTSAPPHAAQEALAAQPTALNARRGRASADTAFEATMAEEQATSKTESAKLATHAGPTLEESAKKADQLFTHENWPAAAAAYRDLLARYPNAKDVSKWRERMNKAILAQQESEKAKTGAAGKTGTEVKAAKARPVDDVLKGSSK